jgi:hypothetical protein
MIEPMPEPHQRQGFIGAHRMRGDFGDQRHVLAGREAGDQIVELEDKADMFATIARQFAVAGISEIVIAEAHAAGAGAVEAAENVEQGRLAGSRRAEQHRQFSIIEVDIETTQRLHLDIAGKPWSRCKLERRLPARALLPFR